jgi:hypothetical protein
MKELKKKKGIFLGIKRGQNRRLARNDIAFFHAWHATVTSSYRGQHPFKSDITQA